MNDKSLQFLVILSTVVMIALNGLAATGVLGGVDTGKVSDKFSTQITPPGYAFAIWSVIYLGVIIFSIFQALPTKRDSLKPIRIPFITSCAANALWLYVWALAYDTPLLMIVCQILITALLISLAVINVRLKRTETIGDFWAVKVPFGIYFGWVTAATILNFTIMLIAVNPNLRNIGDTADYLGAALMLTAGVIGVAVRFAVRNYFYPLGIAWATVTIAFGHSSQRPVMLAAVAAFVACLIAAGLFVIDMPDSKTSRV